MEDRSFRRMRILVTTRPVRGLAANETACAMTSMMARSTNRSKPRPDTLMQDRNPDRSTKFSCDARPDHTCGSRRDGMITQPIVRCHRSSGRE
jgi:hypothetical protein